MGKKGALFLALILGIQLVACGQMREEQHDGEGFMEQIAEEVTSDAAHETLEAEQESTSGKEPEIDEVNSEVSDEQQDEYSHGKKIEDQSFNVTLAPFGEVTFASYNPDRSTNQLADAVFLIEKGDDILCKLPAVEGWGAFYEVEAVSFLDYNKDEYDDIILITSYLFGAGPQGAIPRSMIRYYKGSESGEFSYEEQMSEDATFALAEITIQTAKDFIGCAVFENLPGQSAPILGDADTIDYFGQLQIIANNTVVWMGDTEGIAESYYYAVTDLDQNGRLEIIQSSCQGTGLYTYTELWEVDADGTGIVPCEYSIDEGDSQPDIITNSVRVYFDGENDCYFYIFSDDIRNGAAEYYQNQVAFSLQGGVVTTTLLGQSHSIYASFDSGAVSTYTDGDGNTIDEEAYNVLADKAFIGQTSMEATIGWTDYDISAQLVTLTKEEILGVLETSWKSFSLS